MAKRAIAGDVTFEDAFAITPSDTVNIVSDAGNVQGYTHCYPMNVAAGVPVDNTVGTALLTLSTLQTYAQAVWNTQTSAVTTAGSIGERMKEASTVAITGQQIAGFDI